MSKVGLSYNLRNIRIIYGYTQKDVSMHLNIERQTYNHYETGKRTPSLEIIIELTKFYQVTTDYLIFSNTIETISEHFPDYRTVEENKQNYLMVLSQSEAILIQNIRILPVSARHEIMKFVELKIFLLKKLLANRNV